MRMYYLQVAVPLHLYDLFTYKSVQKIEPGCRVRINFKERNIIGVVIECYDSNPTDFSECKIKSVVESLDQEPYADSKTLELLRFTAKYQHTPLGMIINLAQPVAVRKGLDASRKPRFAYRLVNREYETKAVNQHKVIELLRNQDVSLTEFKGLNIPATCLRSLENKGIIRKFDLNEMDTDIFLNLKFSNQLTLNDEQRTALSAINSVNYFKVFLLKGVTGSGKTEVYMQAIETVLSRKQQVLVMVPEIGLTPQTIERFHKHFNVPIAAMHSSLSDRERLDNYLACRDGKIGILIGTRSSVFTPFKSLGLVVIDEEHDQSYKQQDTCRYNGKNIAIYKAKIADCPIILGTATPSLESYYNSKIGKYKLLELHNNAVLHHGIVTKGIIDLKHCSLSSGMSDHLINEMERELQKGNQVLIFLNRRGFANKIICNNCGYVFQCKFCDSFLTYHKNKNILNCHHCETNYPIPRQCPECNSNNIDIMGNGTEQLEEFLKSRFPDYPVIRIDRDTATHQYKLGSYIDDIKNNKYKILIGTQILSKGHHFPNVTLVGLLNIDQSLFSNDFRATEQLAQLYTQIAGRTGREEKDGRVLIQSYVPNNALLQTIINDGYDKFAELCLRERKYLNLPPFSFQALFRIVGSNKELLNCRAIEIYNTLLQIDTEHGLTITEPKPALMEKKQNKYHLILMIQSSSRKQLSTFLDKAVIELAKGKINSKVEYFIDVDPSEVLQ